MMEDWRPGAVHRFQSLGSRTTATRLRRKNGAYRIAGAEAEFVDPPRKVTTEQLPHVSGLPAFDHRKSIDTFDPLSRHAVNCRQFSGCSKIRGLSGIQRDILNDRVPTTRRGLDDGRIAGVLRNGETPWNTDSWAIRD